MQHDTNPSVLALSRQAVENLRKAPSDENLSAKGAYVLTEPEGGRDVTLIGTGSELALAVEAAKTLGKEGVRAAVVSMPSMELFRAQPESYRAKVLGNVPRVAVEAGVVAVLVRVARRQMAASSACRTSVPRRPAPQALRALRRHGRCRRRSRAQPRQEVSRASMDFTKLKPISDADVSGKRVLVRADLNVPVADGKVTDATRLERILAGLKDLSARNARVVVISHFGRPKGGPDPTMSLAPVAAKLAELLGKPVQFVDACIGDAAEDAVSRLAPGGIAVLENLRFHKGEEKNDQEFVTALARSGDVFVNDAFSAAHRAHASTEGLARVLPAYAGPLMLEEIAALCAVLEKPQRPTAALVGGAKVSSKIPILKHLAGKVDKLIIGGGMANTFLLSHGVDIGKSLAEPDFVETAREIMTEAKARGCAVVLPEDAVIAREFKSGRCARHRADARRAERRHDPRRRPEVGRAHGGRAEGVPHAAVERPARRLRDPALRRRHVQAGPRGGAR